MTEKVVRARLGTCSCRVVLLEDIAKARIACDSP